MSGMGGHAGLLTSQQVNKFNAPVRAAYGELEAAEAAVAATPRGSGSAISPRT